MSEEKTMSKEDIVVSMVKEGKHTREEIRNAAGCTAGSFASYLTGMRMAAKHTGSEIYPIEVEDPNDPKRKVFTVATFDKVEEMKAERAASTPAGPKKTPEERYQAAVKRLERCKNSLAKARERAELNTGSRELELRTQKAEIEFELAGIELQRAKNARGEVPEETIVAGDDELM